MTDKKFLMSKLKAKAVAWCFLILIGWMILGANPSFAQSDTLYKEPPLEEMGRRTGRSPNYLVSVVIVDTLEINLRHDIVAILNLPDGTKLKFKTAKGFFTADLFQKAIPDTWLELEIPRQVFESLRYRIIYEHTVVRFPLQEAQNRMVKAQIHRVQKLFPKSMRMPAFR